MASTPSTASTCRPPAADVSVLGVVLVEVVFGAPTSAGLVMFLPTLDAAEHATSVLAALHVASTLFLRTAHAQHRQTRGPLAAQRSKQGRTGM